MSHFFWDSYRTITGAVNQMEVRHWMFVGVGVVLLGALCLRGFGSRANY